jgi:hypothetical protein
MGSDSTCSAIWIVVQDRLFGSDFDRVVTETKRLDEGAPKGRSRKRRKP